MDEAAFPQVAGHPPVSFRMLDLHAFIAFQTAGSVSYNLERDMGYGVPGKRLGWIDIHYPCTGPTRANIRVIVTQDYFDSSMMNTIVRTSLNVLNISLSERFEAEFVFQPTTMV